MMKNGAMKRIIPDNPTTLNEGLKKNIDTVRNVEIIITMEINKVKR